MSFRTRVYIGTIAVLVIITSGFASTQYSVSEPAAVVESTQTFDVTLAIEGVQSLRTIVVAEGTTALDLLRAASPKEGFRLVEKEYAGLGTLVEQIGEFKNGTNGKYWTYTVSGVFAPVGADSYELKHGDSIEWKFEEPQEF